MTTGTGFDSWLTRRLRNKALEDDFKCTFCPPHRWENEGRRHGRYVRDAEGFATFVPAKGKDRK